MVLASLKKVQDICLYEWGSVCGVLGKLFPFCFVNIFIFFSCRLNQRQTTKKNMSISLVSNKILNKTELLSKYPL